MPSEPYGTERPASIMSLYGVWSGGWSLAFSHVGRDRTRMLTPSHRNNRGAGQVMRYSMIAACLAAGAALLALLFVDLQFSLLLVAAFAAGAAAALAAISLSFQNDTRVASLSAQLQSQLPQDNLRPILDGIPGFVHTLTPAGEVEYVNKGIIDFFGLPADNLRDWSGVTHPDDVPRITPIIERALREGTVVDMESRGRRADGVYRWFNSRGMPLQDGTGRIVRWYFSLTDIDDRKRAEEALQANEQHLRLLVESIPGMICTSSPDGELEYANQQLLDYSKRSFDEIRDWRTTIHPDDVAMVADLWKVSVETGVPLEVGPRLERADGAYRWFQISGRPLRDAEGRILRWYHLVTDVHDRKIAEEKLRARERELRLIVETLPACIWCASPGGTLDYVNDRVLEYTGASFEQLVNNFDFVHPDDRFAVADAWTRCADAGTPFEMQYRHRHADGSHHWVQSIGQLGRDEQGQPTRWYGLFIDIEERMRMEEALRESRARLSRATQIATAGELSAAIAHEINQPLAAVIANSHACSSWMSAEPPNIPRARLVLERIIRDAMSAAEVVRKIRALYRHAPPSKDLLSINEVVGEIGMLVEAEARRRSVTIRTDLAPGLPPALADRVQMQQVLANLCRNAMDAMEAVEDGHRELTITSSSDGNCIVVTVLDTGTGVQDLASVFEPFFSTKQNGMGMGLAISRSIIEAHGGILRAERREPRGSSFSFSIPCR